jgi:hypothetical protein
MVGSTCLVHSDYMESQDSLIEHLRGRHHAGFISRPGPVGYSDAHGHIWYCLDCESVYKSHRSFDSSQAMLDHLRRCHEWIMDNIRPGNN